VPASAAETGQTKGLSHAGAKLESGPATAPM
jgi:hypothetical protein